MCCSAVCLCYRYSGAHYHSDRNVKYDVSSDDNTNQTPPPTVIVKYEPTANKLLLIAIPVSTAAITVIIVSVMTLLYTFRRCGKCLLISFEVVLSCSVRDVE